MRKHSHRRGVALLAVLALAPGATGCTTALADEIVRQPRWLERVSDADIRRTLEQRPDVKLPARLVVMGDPGSFGGRVLWDGGERHRIEEALAPLAEGVEGEGVGPGCEGALLRETIVIETPLPRMPDAEGAAFEYLKAHRLAAAQRQAEVAVVLIPMSADATSTSPLDRDVGRAEARAKALDATLERFVPELTRALVEPYLGAAPCPPAGGAS